MRAAKLLPQFYSRANIIDARTMKIFCLKRIISIETLWSLNRHYKLCMYMPYVLIYRSSTIHCFTEFLLNSVFISSRHYARAERSNCLQTQINMRWWPWWFCRLTHCQTWAVIEVLPLLTTKSSSCLTLSTGHIPSTHRSEFGWTFAQRHIVVFPARLPQRRCITHQGASYDFIRFALERQGLVHIAQGWEHAHPSVSGQVWGHTPEQRVVASILPRKFFGLRLAIAQADARPAMPVSLK